MDYFYRSILQELVQWKNQKDRKPLVLRGARQVGKTTVVEMFAREFEQYIYLNLEQENDRELFEGDYTFDEALEALFFLNNKSRDNGATLVFIDEIQQSPKAVADLRYFYEDAPDIYVIAAGSLLETLIDTHISFPVGRVEYKVIRAFSFEEYLYARNEQQALELVRQKIPCPAYAHNKLSKLFFHYTLIGGMPAVLKKFAEAEDLTALQSIYESLLTSYLNDVEKYARNDTMARVIRHTIRHIFYYPAARITFNGFGQSSYRYREIKEAFDVLEKAMLVQVVYPVTSTKIPAQPNLKKRPRLLVLDTGLANYFSGMQKPLFKSRNVEEVYQGQIAEHITAQQIQALSSAPMYMLHFWTREKKDSNAEVDFVYPWEDMLIPLEVKSGAKGSLRSLHQFMDKSVHPYAVRVYSGKLQVEKAQTVSGTPFYLLNLPFYLLNQFPAYMEWFIATQKPGA